MLYYYAFLQRERGDRVKRKTENIEISKREIKKEKERERQKNAAAR